MARCSYCNESILFGARRNGELRFCNAKCEKNGLVQVVANTIPDVAVVERYNELLAGPCVSCKSVDPCSVYTSHRVWSAVLFTTWYSRPTVCCKACGNKRRIWSMLFSALFGWWGFPFGLIVTPIVLVRNVISFFEHEATVFTPEIETHVRAVMAKESNPSGKLVPRAR